MPSFSFKDTFRRSSRSFPSSTESINNVKVSNGVSNGNGNGAPPGLPSRKSSSTLNSVFGGSIHPGQRTPPSNAESSNSSTAPPTTSNGTSRPASGTSPPSINGSIPPVPPRPNLNTRPTNRYSVGGMSGLGSPSTDGLPTSQYAPVVTSMPPAQTVYCKHLLIQGTVGEPSNRQQVDGTVTVSHFDESLAVTQWSVSESHFKALVPLNAGKNSLRLSFTSPKLANVSSNNIHASNFYVQYIPQTNTPPLQLVILLAKDSPGTFDSTPSRIEREGNNLDTAIAKYRMAAYLWQSYTQEQMSRNRLGRRTFRFEEEWTSGTASMKDRVEGNMRSEAKVHVVRSSKTLAEMRDLEVAQQNPKASRSGDLFSWASSDVKEYFKVKPGQTQYVAVLLLDAHWDKSLNMILGHAALGGGDDSLRLAIFGSQALQSYPSYIEEVPLAFTNCTRTDTDHVANDCNESGSDWEAANIGIGAHMHEVGHLFGCPHQESGVMLRDYVHLNRTFVTREAYSTRTKAHGGLVLQESECNWHRLDCLRFRIHPCFRLNGDVIQHKDPSVEVWPIENGVFISARSGVAYTEIFVEGEEQCKAWIEHGDGNGRGPISRHYFLTETEIRERLPEDQRKKNIRLCVKSFGNGNADVPHISASKESMVKIPGGNLLSTRYGFKGHKYGLSQMDGSEKSEIIFDSFAKQGKVMTSIVVYSGNAVDGLEFCYEDSTSQLVGKQGGSPNRFYLDIRRGEIISGFNIRAGFWIDAIQIITSYGRVSDMYGSGGGSGSYISAPRGYNIAGVSATAGPWMDGFQAIISR